MCSLPQDSTANYGRHCLVCVLSNNTNKTNSIISIIINNNSSLKNKNMVRNEKQRPYIPTGLHQNRGLNLKTNKNPVLPPMPTKLREAAVPLVGKRHHLELSLIHI